MAVTKRKRPIRRFKRYPAYRDSGVEWLGEIPAHWVVKRLWHLTPSDRQIMYGIVLPGPNVWEGVPIVKAGDVASERLHVDQLNRTTFEIEAGYARSRLRGGDLVYAIRGSIGEVAIIPPALEGANLTQDAARVAHTPATDGRWLLYALKSSPVFAQLEAGAVGATIKGVNIRDLKRARLPVPNQSEQEAIAAFLDRETARIDALVAKKERLIELLLERRAAVVTRAVTKGLNPDVPMKNSGVDWLRDIPAHWSSERIKWTARMESSYTPDKKVASYWDGGRDATIGLCAITRGGMAVSQYFIGRVCGERLLPEYLLFTLRSMTEEPESLTMGATVRTMGMADVRNLVTPVPPIAEQQAIVEYVLRSREEIDSLVSRVNEATTRLRELRTALISAAVTGKIDVREQAAGATRSARCGMPSNRLVHRRTLRSR